MSWGAIVLSESNFSLKLQQSHQQNFTTDATESDNWETAFSLVEWLVHKISQCWGWQQNDNDNNWLKKSQKTKPSDSWAGTYNERSKCPCCTQLHTARWTATNNLRLYGRISWVDLFGRCILVGSAFADSKLGGCRSTGSISCRICNAKQLSDKQPLNILEGNNSWNVYSCGARWNGKFQDAIILFFVWLNHLFDGKKYCWQLTCS